MAPVLKKIVTTYIYQFYNCTISYKKQHALGLILMIYLLYFWRNV